MKKTIFGILMLGVLISMCVGCGTDAISAEPTEMVVEDAQPQTEPASLSREDSSDEEPSEVESSEMEPSESEASEVSHKTEVMQAEVIEGEADVESMAAEQPSAVAAVMPSSTQNTEDAALIYTYTEMSAIMYAQSNVNVRDLPNTDGNKVGELSVNQQVAVTGQCNETSWYRFDYNGTTAYVSNKYLNESEIVVRQEERFAQASESSAANETMVWIPKTGSKYHSNSGCSGMKNPTQVTLSQAESMGYTPCKKCY